jgi:hypothetical protein
MLTRQELEEVVSAAVARAIAEATCSCGLDSSERKEVAHFFGMVRDVGQGDVGRGVEAMRRNNEWAAKYRGLSERVGSTVLITAITALTLGVLGLIATWLHEK